VTLFTQIWTGVHFFQTQSNLIDQGIHSMFNSAFTATCVLIQPLRTLHHQTDWLPKTVNRFYTHLEPYIWPLASIAHTITVWTVVLVTADRYAAVRWPCNKRLRSQGSKLWHIMRYKISQTFFCNCVSSLRDYEKV